MRGTYWTLAVILFGFTGALVGTLVSAGALPTTWSFGAVTVVPLLVLGAAFVGVMSTGAYIVGSLVALVAIAAPIIDVTTASLAAGNFDDATGYGIATGIAISAAGAVAYAAAARRVPALPDAAQASSPLL